MYWGCLTLDTELWDIYEGLITTWSMRIRNLVVEVDSLDAIGVVQQGLLGRISLALVRPIVDMLNHSWSVKIQHIFCEGNRLARGMTKLASTEDLSVFVPSEMRFTAPPLDVLN
ncbi:hypothetical protein V6N11_066421 [Hibiscus sabdariffa]